VSSWEDEQRTSRRGGETVEKVVMVKGIEDYRAEARARRATKTWEGLKLKSYVVKGTGWGVTFCPSPVKLWCRGGVSIEESLSESNLTPYLKGRGG